MLLMKYKSKGFNMSSIGNVIVSLIEKHSQNETIDIMAMAQSMGISVDYVEMKTSTDVAIMKQGQEDKRPKIELNKTNKIEQNHTLVALLLADCLIAPKKTQREGLSMRFFFLKVYDSFV